MFVVAFSVLSAFLLCLLPEGLPPEVRADLADNNAYWAQFQDTAVQKVSNEVYDRFLKGYGEEQGLQSYGTVVDLLVVYYRDAAV